MQIPPPYDQKFLPFKTFFLPLLVTVQMIILAQFAVTVIWLAAVSNPWNLLSVLFWSLLQFIIVGSWIWLYFKRIMDGTWTLFMFAVSAVISGASFGNRINYQSVCRYHCQMHLAITALSGADVLCMAGLAGIGFVVWRAERAGKGGAWQQQGPA